MILILHPQTKNIRENLDELKRIINSRYGVSLSIAPMTTEDFRKNLWKKQPAILSAVKERIVLLGEESFWNVYSSFLGGEYYGK